MNSKIEELNNTTAEGDALRKLIKVKQNEIIKYLEKELKYVTKNYYKNLWFVLGMSMFGVPIGVIIGTSQDNMSLLGLGFPFGILIGILVGSRLDKKAFEEGRQIDIEIKN
ncbi:MAG: hypothetical protein HC854_02700 [Flavobacterium sp.]|nr:hypothetical protein [Flavobacterium sp.]